MRAKLVVLRAGAGFPAASPPLISRCRPRCRPQLTRRQRDGAPESSSGLHQAYLRSLLMGSGVRERAYIGAIFGVTCWIRSTLSRCPLTPLSPHDTTLTISSHRVDSPAASLQTRTLSRAAGRTGSPSTTRVSLFPKDLSTRTIRVRLAAEAITSTRGASLPVPSPSLCLQFSSRRGVSWSQAFRSRQPRPQARLSSATRTPPNRLRRASQASSMLSVGRRTFPGRASPRCGAKCRRSTRTPGSGRRPVSDWLD